MQAFMGKVRIGHSKCQNGRLLWIPYDIINNCTFAAAISKGLSGNWFQTNVHVFLSNYANMKDVSPVFCTIFMATFTILTWALLFTWGIEYKQNDISQNNCDKHGFTVNI